jgi:putative transposon-encoded protein
MVNSEIKLMKKKIETEGYELIERIVKPTGKGAHVYLPKDWEGKKVQIILSEPLNDKKEKEGK